MAKRHLLRYAATVALTCGLSLSLQGKVHPPASEPSACDPPFDLSVTDTRETEADLRWDVTPTGIGVNVQYAPKGSNAWQDAGSEVTDKFFKLTGLQPGTEYEWRIQTACGAGPSVWVTSSFSTNGSKICPTPFNLINLDISGNRAVVGWTSFLGTKYYEVEYRADTSSTWLKFSSSYLNDHEFKYIDSLQPLTTYRWRVRAVCENSVSEWTDSSFTTTSGLPIDAGIILASNFVFKMAPCDPAKIIFANTSDVARTTVTQLLWNFGDGSTSTQNDPIHIYKKPGRYPVTLTIADNNGKTSAKTIQVEIRELTSRFANAGKNITVCSKEAIQLNATGGVKYEWQPCTAMSNCNIATPTIIPGTAQRYMVKVTNEKGCTDTASVSVRYIGPSANTMVPNAFTPNNNAVNDTFRPLANLGVQDAELIIADRWGNRVLVSSGIAAAWDGTHNGKPMPSGIYTYMIRLKGNTACADKTIRGTVMLIR